jgi:hypothetical protein
MPREKVAIEVKMLNLRDLTKLVTKSLDIKKVDIPKLRRKHTKINFIA